MVLKGMSHLIEIRGESWGLNWGLAWTEVESHLQMFSFVQSHLRKIVKERSRNVRVQRSESDHDIPAT